jgi:hypothetical protein
MAEGRRIIDLPTRDWRAQAGPFVERLSDLLRAPGGDQTLRLAQAAGLLEGPAVGGLVVNGRMGIGKTALLALMPRIVRAKRPLILTMGGIKKETIRHIGRIRSQWLAPVDTLVHSYTKISKMPGRGETLEMLWPDETQPNGGHAPDFIGCDEVDRLGNPGAAMTKVIGEWREAYPEAFFMGVTATLDDHGLAGYAHIFAWALGQLSPLPLFKTDIDAWHEVVTKGDMRQSVQVCQDLGIAKSSGLDAIRGAFKARLHATPGVIVEDTPFVAVPLTLRSHLLEIGLDAQFQKLRELGQRDDGIDVLPDAPDADESEEDAPEAEPATVDRVHDGMICEVARQYGRGFFYKMDPSPPEEWAVARRKYFSWVRARLEEGQFKSELQAREHAIRYGLRVWLEWAALKPTFVPSSRTVWLTRDVLDWAHRWGTAAPGLIWTEHTAVGLELERVTGWTYYGGRGLSARGEYIEDAPKHKTLIASRRANSVGRNLQYHLDRMLFLQPITRPEQALGRLHREGIESWSSGVHADVLVTCSEDLRAISKCRALARGTEASFYSQKVAQCPWEHVERPEPAAWAFGKT